MTRPRIDRTYWPAGPWDDEPDVVRWISTGPGVFRKVRCTILRNTTGNLCGYVYVPKFHPWYELSIREARGAHSPGLLDDVPVHGGITYCEKGRIGFDCGHYCDIIPALSPSRDREIYRDIPYVRAECEKLAQAARDAVEDPIYFAVHLECARKPRK